jgi:riboflavin biosynthesis pyrimidine reductase
MDGKIFVEGGWTGLSKMSTEDIVNEIELRNSLQDQTL